MDHELVSFDDRPRWVEQPEELEGADHTQWTAGPTARGRAPRARQARAQGSGSRRPGTAPRPRRGRRTASSDATRPRPGRIVADCGIAFADPAPGHAVHRAGGGRGLPAAPRADVRAVHEAGGPRARRHGDCGVRHGGGGRRGGGGGDCVGFRPVGAVRSAGGAHHPARGGSGTGSPRCDPGALGRDRVGCSERGELARRELARRKLARERLARRRAADGRADRGRASLARGGAVVRGAGADAPGRGAADRDGDRGAPEDGRGHDPRRRAAAAGGDTGGRGGRLARRRGRDRRGGSCRR